MAAMTAATGVASACSSKGDPTPANEPAEAAGECPAADYASLVGTNMAAVTLPADLKRRMIGPDTIVTMDYKPERLNIYTDEDGVVERVACG